MKLSIDTINSRQCTVVWHEPTMRPVNPVWARTQHGYEMFIYEDGGLKHLHIALNHIATALYALPKHPKPEDAPLLYQYMAEGLFPSIISHAYEDNSIVMTVRGVWGGQLFVDFKWEDDGETGEGFCLFENSEITHCIDTSGNRIEVAIEDRSE